MTTQWIDIAAKDGGTYGAYLALPPRPGAGGRNPGLVLFQEIFGVNAHIRAVAEQYALDGFVVLAPDVFWRDAPRVELGYEGADMERAMQLMNGADDRRLADDVATTVAALRARPEVAGKVASIGYCMGGRLAYVAAATAGVDAAVCYYGGGIHNQLDLAPRVACPGGASPGSFCWWRSPGRCRPFRGSYWRISGHPAPVARAGCRLSRRAPR